MFRWIAIIAAVALAIGTAFAQSSSPQVQPMPPVGQGQMMGSPMMNGAAPGTVMMDPSMMPMMQMMGSGMMVPGMMSSGMMGPGMMMGQDMAGPMMCRAQMGMMRSGMMGTALSYLEARLAFVKSELAIDQAEEADWQKYASTVRSQTQPMFARMSGMQQATGPDFPARFDARVTMLEGQLSSLKATRDAAVGLYGKLNAEQKAKADMLLPMSLCM